jgi:hypothetical protein
MEEYTKVVIEDGKENIVTLTRHQWICDRLSLPEETPELEVNAAWEQYQLDTGSRNQKEKDKRGRIQAARNRLFKLNPALINTMDDHAAIIALAGAIADIRDILGVDKLEDEEDE